MHPAIRRAAIEAFEDRRYLSSISGETFRDANGDGVQSATEVGVANCTVYLDVNNSGSYQWNDPSTNSDANGNYTLTLPSGSGNSTVVIGVLSPSGQSGWQSTNANTLSVNIPDDSQGSQEIAGQNFGLLQVGPVSGTVFNDSNNNGSQDYGESGLNYCFVYYDPTGQGYYNSNDLAAMTASDGSYQIQNVPDSGGAVFVQAPSGWQQTYPANGAGAPISFNNPVNFGAYDAAEYNAASQAPTGLAATSNILTSIR